MKTVTSFQCDFCKRLFKTSRNCKKHERVCFFNDNNETCYNCIHYDYLKMLCAIESETSMISKTCEKFQRRIGDSSRTVESDFSF